MSSAWLSAEISSESFNGGNSMEGEVGEYLACIALIRLSENAKVLISLTKIQIHGKCAKQFTNTKITNIDSTRLRTGKFLRKYPCDTTDIGYNSRPLRS